MRIPQSKCESLDLLHQWSPLLFEDQWRRNGEGEKVIGDTTSRGRWVKNKLTTIGSHGYELEGRRRWEEGEGEKGHEIYALNAVWTLKYNFSNDQSWKKCTHKASIYSLSVIQNWREIWISIQISLEFKFELVEPKFHSLWLVNFSYVSAHQSKIKSKIHTKCA